MKEPFPYLKTAADIVHALERGAVVRDQAISDAVDAALQEARRQGLTMINVALAHEAMNSVYEKEYSTYQTPVYKAIERGLLTNSGVEGGAVLFTAADLKQYMRRFRPRRRTE